MMNEVAFWFDSACSDQVEVDGFASLALAAHTYALSRTIFGVSGFRRKSNFHFILLTLKLRAVE